MVYPQSGDKMIYPESGDPPVALKLRCHILRLVFFDFFCVKAALPYVALELRCNITR